MPQVSQLLLEFLHKYVADVVSDAAVYQEHAGRSEVDIDDLRLAIQVGKQDGFKARVHLCANTEI